MRVGSPRMNGSAKRGERCHGTYDWQARGRTNVLLTPSLTTAKFDAEIFNLWVEQDLLSKLPSGAVTVMDNATCHKRGDTRAMTETPGHTLEYLPPYSPDLNPIERK